MQRQARKQNGVTCVAGVAGRQTAKADLTSVELRCLAMAQKLEVESSRERIIDGNYSFVPATMTTSLYTPTSLQISNGVSG